MNLLAIPTSITFICSEFSTTVSGFLSFFNNNDNSSRHPLGDVKNDLLAIVAAIMEVHPNPYRLSSRLYLIQNTMKRVCYGR
ncbi:unnamed protein product [Schistosoma curassoni]|uniref:Uncharacterized protein n=1 Tax=Schistosoma curassoni TaxID=6186 RepID=A0A183KXJ5_9TREM|nr:unnamed protein product [Schistosoma curassoni]